MNAGGPTRVAIVNDVPLVAEALRRIVNATPDFSVAWIARDGLDALAKAGADRPDVILMDLVMPVMDGVEATRRIMATTPCPILLVTATVSGNLTMVFDALGHGALDVVQTPGFGRRGEDDGTRELRQKLVSVARLVEAPSDRPRPSSGLMPRPSSGLLPRATRDARPSGGAPADTTGATPPVIPVAEAPLLLIAASTGGPQAIATLLEGAGPRLPAAVVILQHLDARFGASFLAWLAARSPLPVAAAVAGERPRRGHVAVAVGEEHLLLDAAGVFRFSPDPDDAPLRPSADVLFTSVAARQASRGVAVVLTGMGRDGARGMLALRRKGFHTIAQDPATSVIGGMPRAAVSAGGAMEVLPIEGIGPRVAAVLRGRVG
jgi:two-component system response regulator WspF